MTGRRVVVAVLLVLTALMLELTLLSRLGFPGVTPDLVTVVVAGLALALGPGGGAAVGFGAGLALDLAPPADGTLGISALILAAIGYAAGAALDPVDRPVLPSIGVVAASAAASLLGTAILASLLGGTRVIWDDVPSMTLATVLYAALMAPFLVPAIEWLAGPYEQVPR